jgi:DNA-directed RNA polymerase subunit RPC12/RpoP
MVLLGIWNNANNFDKIDVASDINTIKIALRTGILKPAIPLLSSFMDVFCHQYAYTDEMNAKAWRRVWEIWKEKYPTECISSPCLMDYFIYNFIGKQICKETLTDYVCQNCGNEFYWYTSRKSKCPKCNSKELKKTKSLPCQSCNGNIVIENTKDYKNNDYLKSYTNCPFRDVCNNGGNIKLKPPKSISIKGATGWTEAYADEVQGGGGLMA